MTIVNVTEQSNVAKYLVITEERDPSTLLTTRLLISDNANNTIRLVDIRRGPEGPQGPQGIQGAPGRDGASFDVLPINSGGTNNTIFANDKIIYYDGNKLSSTDYSIEDLLNTNNNKAITGIIEGTGISKTINESSVIINTNLGDGLSVNNNNQIIVDDSIARKVELTVGNISGTLGIFKGGTNNTFFNTNRLVYFDGTKLTSFPLDTGRIVTSGSTINIVAGSGLLGGGSLSIPSGSVVLNIGPSDDVFVSENAIQLSTTGTAGTYTKVVTDIKGRVVSGTSITRQDIIDILGYTPWHAGNDGPGSNLDADLLDGRDGSYYLNFNNFTGTIQSNVLPDITTAGTYSKVTVSSKGLVLNGNNINYTDVVSALGYRPVSTTGDTIAGNLNVNGDVLFQDGELKLEDNLPIFSYNNTSLMPNDPRGFSFVYGNSFRQTGILAYYPAENELKLITRIFGPGDNDIGGGDSTDFFNGEVDGGDSDTVFLFGNIQGEQAIVLLRHIADERYMRRATDQIISGIKTFVSPINVFNRINILQQPGYQDQPIDVGANSGLNINLNSDLLDGEHGSYYRDAYNLTGILDYTDTVVTNLEGTVDYIPKFDNRTQDPSRTISDSIIRQSGDSNIFIDDGSLSVGNNNIEEIKSLAVGTNNTITSQNSLAAGQNNTVKANNSVAINFGATANTTRSLAMGSYGTTWLPNQLSIGAFEELSPINNTTRMGLGQHSMSAIGYYGTATSFSNLTPTITIPKNKTVLYNIDLLFSKFAGTVAAAFSFSSGIVKNYENTVSLVQAPTKTEIYNDSQIRDYFYSITVQDDLKSDTNSQVLSVKHPPLQNNNLAVQNLKNIYRIKPDLSEISGYFSKTFDGNIILKMHKPISSGTFKQLPNDGYMKISCKDHGVVPNCITTVNFTTGNIITPPSSGYKVISSLNSNEFIVVNPYFDSSQIDNSGYATVVRKRSFNSKQYKREPATFSGYKCVYVQQPFSNGTGTIDFVASDNIIYADNYNPYIKFETALNVFSGVLTSGSTVITECNPVQTGRIVAGMKLSSDVAGFPSMNEVLVSPTDETIQMSLPFTGTSTTGLIVYSGVLPPEDNYTKTIFSGPNLSVERVDGTQTGFYISGTAIVYSNYGSANIKIDLIDQANIQSGEFCYLNFLTAAQGSTIPVSDNYFMVSTDIGEINVVSYHLLPDSGLPTTGLVVATVDKDHGFVPPSVKPDILQQIPLSFSVSGLYDLMGVGTRNNPTNRKPKDGIFDVSGVTGDYIFINTFKDSLLKEVNSPLVYDRFTASQYVADTGNDVLKIGFNKNYLQVDDQIYCSFKSSNQHNQNFRITGIDTDKGTYYAKPVSGYINSITPESGELSFIGACSGYAYSPINNIYFHSYGGRSESWGRDYGGKYIDPPLTGFFSVCNSRKSCGSGMFCVKIDGISDFSHINAGDKLYFDFVDLTGFNLYGIFNVYDKLSPNTLTISVPQHANYTDKLCFINEHESGLVYLIDSLENIKTDKHPNYSNLFSSSTLTINPSNTELYTHKLSCFNDSNNRWKHCLSLPNVLAPKEYLEELTVSVDGQTSPKIATTIIVVNPADLDFTLSYQQNEDEYVDIVENSNIQIPKKSNLKLRITTSNGAGKWADSVTKCAPRVNIVGISDYTIEESKLFDESLKQWQITINCGAINQLVTNKNVKVIVSDESGRKEKSFSLTVPETLTVANIENTVHGYAGVGSYWELMFDVYSSGLNSSFEPTIISPLSVDQGFPSSDANSYVYNTLNNIPNDWYTIRVRGLPGSTTGVYNPVMIVNDNFNNIEITGTILIKSNAGSDAQQYKISPRRFTSDINILYGSNISSNFSFALPVFVNDSEIGTQPKVEWHNTSTLSISSLSSSWYNDFSLFTCQSTISGMPGYYNPQLKIKVTQPSGSDYAEYVLETGVNVTIYENLYIDITQLVQPLKFDLDKPWVFDFYVTKGASAHRSDLPPKVYLGNTPNIGIYPTSPGPLEYDISKTYDSANKYWKISVTGKPDFFGEYAAGTGTYPIYIYAEDYTGHNQVTLLTEINTSLALQNINTNKYATPNNAFEFNADIIGGSASVKPNISIPASQSDPLIIPTRQYYKFDENMKVWEASYKCDELTDKWDATVSLVSNSLLVRAKGISDDKIYVAGRVMTVETDNLNTSLNPLKIIGLKPLKNPYEITDGDAWTISFSTSGGLESPLYPPRIGLTGTPTPCSGFDASLAIQQCLAATPQWDNNNKTWSYKFSGSPLCRGEGETPPITVHAVDQIGNGQDNALTKIVYKALKAHPGPTIGSPETLSLYPNCQTYNSGPIGYKIQVRETCPAPTGISGFIEWGSLPPGISRINSRQGYYKAPYSDLSSGNITFFGSPTEFANGGAYPYSYNIAVFDARGRSGVMENVVFTDASAPIESSPTDVTIYFATSGYQYTPKKESKQSDGGGPTITYPSGTKIIEDISTEMLRPPISPMSMQCLSRLPHSNCMYSTGLYTVTDPDTIKLEGPGTLSSLVQSKRNIGNNKKIYVSFDGHPSLNGEYVAKRASNQEFITITVDNHQIDPTSSGPVGILKTDDNIKERSVNTACAEYGGSPPTSVDIVTTIGIMGSGSFKEEEDKKGFMGRIRPSLIASLRSGVFREQSKHLENLVINNLYSPSRGVQDIYSVKFTNCYETGYLRVSGVILPKFSIDSIDPPPARDPQGNPANFTYRDNDNISVAFKAAYGEGSQRNNILNGRQINNVKCIVTNLMTDVKTIDIERNTEQDGTASFFIGQETFNSSLNGAVFKLYFNYISPEIFPTYKKTAIPSADATYYWVHKGFDNFSNVLTNNTFPPVIPVHDKDLMFVSGNNVPIDILCVGGFIPVTNPQNKTYKSYPPHITGYLQQTYFSNVSGTYIQPQESGYLNVLFSKSGIFDIGDRIKIKFTSYPGYLPLDIPETGIIIEEIIDDTLIRFNDMPIDFTNTKSGTVEISDIFTITSENNPISHEVRILHRTGVKDLLSVNTSIDLVETSLNNSSNIHKKSILTKVFPNPYRLNIISGSMTESYAALDGFVFSGTLTNDSNEITNCHPSPLNILSTGLDIQLYSFTHGLPDPHFVTNITNDTITISDSYFGDNANDVVIYFRGREINGYYSHMLDINGTGLCDLRHNLYKTDNTPIISFSGNATGAVPQTITFNGQSSFRITGIPDRTGYYNFAIITSENSGLLYDNFNSEPGGGSIDIKRYMKDYKATLIEPIRIINSTNLVGVNPNDTWTYNFAVTGGYAPRYKEFLEIELNNQTHTFDRYVNVVSDFGALVSLVPVSLPYGPNYWSQLFNAGVLLRVYDSTGEATETLYKPL